MQTITNEIKAILNRPLPAEAVTPHPSKTYLSSIKSIYVTERLNEAFGIGAWQIATEFIERKEKMVVVKTTLTIPEYGIHYESFGGNDNADLGDAYKGASTDAITKICSWLGIGADVFKGLQTGKKSTPRPSQPQRNPIEAAPPMQPKPKNRITHEMLDDRVKCDCLLNWGYQRWTTTNYSTTFDVGEALLNSYDAEADVLKRYCDLFESYRQARSK